MSLVVGAVGLGGVSLSVRGRTPVAVGVPVLGGSAPRWVLSGDFAGRSAAAGTTEVHRTGQVRSSYPDGSDPERRGRRTRLLGYSDQSSKGPFFLWHRQCGPVGGCPGVRGGRVFAECSTGSQGTLFVFGV